MPLIRFVSQGTFTNGMFKNNWTGHNGCGFKSRTFQFRCKKGVPIDTQRSAVWIKSLLLSHHHSTSALVSEILMSVLQTVQKNNRQFTYGQTVQKKKKQQTIYIWTDSAKKQQQTIYLWTDSAKKQQQTIYLWTDSAKKTTDNLPMDRQCKKNNRQFTYGQTVQKTALEHLQCSRQCKKTATAIYIWTDSAKKTTAIYLNLYLKCEFVCDLDPTNLGVDLSKMFNSLLLFPFISLCLSERCRLLAAMVGGFRGIF